MPFVNRTIPFAFESLSSLVYRLRELNHYEPNNAILDLLAHPNQDIDLLQLNQDYERLTELLQQPLEGIYNLTIHRFAKYFYPPKTFSSLGKVLEKPSLLLWESRNLAQFVRRQRNGQICPLCLRETHIFPLQWSLQDVTACTIHKVLLVDRCNNCHTPFHRGALLSRCQSCSQKIYSVPSISIAESAESMAVTDFIGRILEYYLQTNIARPSLEDQGYPFTEMDNAMIFELLKKIPYLLAIRIPTMPIFKDKDATNFSLEPKNQTVMDRHRLGVAGWRILADWPNTWYDTLEQVAAAESDYYDKSIRSVSKGVPHFKPFPLVLLEEFNGAEWKWLHNDWYNFVKKKIPTNAPFYRWTQWLQLWEDKCAYPRSFLTVRESAELLDASYVSVKTLVRNGQIVHISQPLTHKSTQLFLEATSVKEFALSRDLYIDVDEAAKICGITQPQMTELIRAGILQSDADFPLKQRRKPWKIHPDRVKTFLQELLYFLPIVQNAEPLLITLDQAMASVKSHKIRFSDLVLAIHSRTLPAFRQDGNWTIKSIYFERSALGKFASAEGKRLTDRDNSSITNSKS